MAKKSENQINWSAGIDHIWDHDGSVIASNIRDRETAALIVHAVSNHDALINAAWTAYRGLTPEQRKLPDGKKIYEAIIKAKPELTV